MQVISLYTGAGGLDLGLEAAGFEISICVEADDEARNTLRLNRPHWFLLEPGDVHLHRPERLLSSIGLRPREASVLAAGPPCQPFSKAAYWLNGATLRMSDPRAATIPAYLAIAETALPEVLLLENVQGLTYDGKQDALEFILDGIRRINRKLHTNYEPSVVCMNAADFGVPQMRARVFLVAHRDGQKFRLPAPTHGPRVGSPRRPHITCWDAIGDLDAAPTDPALQPTGKWADLLPSIPEGKNYLWHTDRSGGLPIFGWRTRFWSFLLKLSKGRPAWTISAHAGPATGPFHWRNRRLSVQETKRLQTFPDSYVLSGSDRSARQQLGNAVPPLLAELIGREIRKQLFGYPLQRPLKFRMGRRRQTPPPEPAGPVPPSYLSLVGEHPAHPGVGKGPRAVTRQ